MKVIAVLSFVCLLPFSEVLAAEAVPSSPTVLGPNDVITVRVLDEDAIPDKPAAIDADGYLHLPMIGAIQAAGLTTRDLEIHIAEKLQFYIREPHVVVLLNERHSRPVSVVGAVNSPGVHQIDGPKRLLEVISAAGGLRPDAGSTARITRDAQSGDLPLPSARKDLSGKYSVAEVDLDTLMRGNNPEQNIVIQPNDVIAVTRADLVFVLGEVKKPGGFPLIAHEKLSVLSALGLAEGMFPTASAKSARILRDTTDGANRKAIPVDVSRIMRGNAPDVFLEPNDILLIPRSATRDIAIKSAEAAVAIGTGLLIWRR